ncbi:unnamed protein product [Pseudo-nitzschia multistriata]|uniref:NTF2 domain-containing protein n=1 Tax=Pseudo-nitzschia multistriata TaxID=183589 RepID=A0A448Z261_9STRA|nr:unnamed protein product [Pseudo-nitzschia multistriata]
MSSTTASGADAFKIGIAFVKQYYKTLSSQPDLLEKFYSQASDAYLSHGEGSEPTRPIPPAGTDHKATIWGCSSDETMLFEFEDGAIDAQPSANEGILLVVTASVIFTVQTTGAERRRKFVQTFFLAKTGRVFAVLNDILRFLASVPEEGPSGEPVAGGASASPEAVPEAPVCAPKEVPEKPGSALVVEEKKSEAAEEKAAAAEGSAGDSTGDESSAPGGGVEESKEEAPDEEEAPKAAPSDGGKKRSSSKEGKGKKNKGGKQQQQQQQKQQPAASKPTPGSWASLVVSGGSAPNTPSRGAVQEKKAAAGATGKGSSKQQPLPPSDKKEAGKPKENGESAAGATEEKGPEKDKSSRTPNPNANANTKHNANAASAKDQKPNKVKDNSTGKDQRTKRDPDNTLVIKNLSDSVKEQDIINMFQPFATLTKAKIVGTNVNYHRNLAFVDYDSVAPVLAALKKHKETPFEWNGRVLDVDQKTQEQRARRKAGGNNQNSNNTNGYRTAGGRGSGGDKFNNNNNNNSNNNSNNNKAGGNGGDRNGRRRGSRAGR